MSTRYLFVTIALLAITSSEAARGCSYRGVRWYVGSDSQAQMTVRNTENCGHNIALYGATRIVSISVAQRAAHGIAGRSGLSSFAYKPNPGYVGTDNFVIKVETESAGSSGTTNIRVDVLVTQ